MYIAKKKLFLVLCTTLKVICSKNLLDIEKRRDHAARTKFGLLEKVSFIHVLTDTLYFSRINWDYELNILSSSLYILLRPFIKVNYSELFYYCFMFS